MADELEADRLEVVVRQNLRVVISRNPRWYRRLCAQHTSRRRDALRWRKHKTSVKRRATLRALRAIAAGRTQLARNFGPPLYARWLDPIIRQEMADERARFRAEQKAAWSGLGEAPF